MAWEAGHPGYFTQILGEKWIHAFTKGISMKWTQIISAGIWIQTANFIFCIGNYYVTCAAIKLKKKKLNIILSRKNICMQKVIIGRHKSMFKI